MTTSVKQPRDRTKQSLPSVVDPGAAVRLRELVALLGLSGRKDAIERAQERLEDAAERYRRHYLHVGADGRKGRLSISNARTTLRNLRAQLEAAVAAVRTVPPDAFLLTAPVVNPDSLRRGLGTLVAEVDRALKCVEEQPDHPRNYERELLAWEVARVLRTELGIKPTKSRPADTTSRSGVRVHRRTGCAYWRLLAATLEVAGVTVGSLRPLVERGIGLLDDPNMPD